MKACRSTLLVKKPDVITIWWSHYDLIFMILLSRPMIFMLRKHHCLTRDIAVFQWSIAHRFSSSMRFLLVLPLVTNWPFYVNQIHLFSMFMIAPKTENEGTTNSFAQLDFLQRTSKMKCLTKKNSQKLRSKYMNFS